MRSPKEIKYQDMVSYLQEQVNWMKKVYPGMKLTRRIHPDTADRNLECAECILKLLKAHQRDRQLNLHDQFKQLQ